MRAQLCVVGVIFTMGCVSRQTYDAARADVHAARSALASTSVPIRSSSARSERFARMIDAGELGISLREERMVLQLPNDVCSTRDTPSCVNEARRRWRRWPRGWRTWRTVGSVGGHTDDVPIATARFRSNWELSTARGLTVVHFLVAHGVPPRGLSAAGYGEFDPTTTSPKQALRAL